MRPKDLAEWIRTEHRKADELAAVLQRAVSVLPKVNQGRWIKEILEAFEHFRAHMLKHFALEEEGGYMVEVLEERPAVAGEVDRLSREHQELSRIMGNVHEEIRELRPEDNLMIRDCARRIQNLLQYVEHHQKDEDLLVLSVFMDDIGTKD